MEDCQKRLKFKKDANNFDLLMQDQEAYLQYEDLGESSNDVDSLLKRHDEFLSKLNAQDEKMKNLNDQFNKLNPYDLYLSELQVTLSQLHKKRENLKKISVERKERLKQAKEIFEFKNECDELDLWIEERHRQIVLSLPNVEQILSNSNNNAEAPYLIDKHLNKQAHEIELNSNRPRLEKLKGSGALLLTKQNESERPLPKSFTTQIMLVLDSVDKNWSNLETEIQFKTKKLLEARTKANLNVSLGTIDSRLKNLKESLNTSENINDLRGAKEALKKHRELSNQLTIEADLINDLNQKKETKQLGRQGSTTFMSEDLGKNSTLQSAIT